MAAAVRQFIYGDNSGTGLADWTASLSSNVLSGSLIVVAYSAYSTSTDPTKIADNVNGSVAYTQDGKSTQNSNSGAIAWMYSFPNSGAGALTVTFNGPSGGSFYQSAVIMEITGAVTATPKDVTNTTENSAANGFTPSSLTLTTLADHDIILAVVSLAAGSLPTVTAGSGLTLIQQNTQSAVGFALATMKLEDAGTAGSNTITESYSGGSAQVNDSLLAVAYKVPSGNPTPSVGSAIVTGIAGRMDRGIFARSTIKGQN